MKHQVFSIQFLDKGVIIGDRVLLPKIGTKRKMAKHIQSGAWAGVERIFGNNGWSIFFYFLQFFSVGRVFSNGQAKPRGALPLTKCRFFHSLLWVGRILGGGWGVVD
jgi:hypothetical protein